MHLRVTLLVTQPKIHFRSNFCSHSRSSSLTNFSKRTTLVTSAAIWHLPTTPTNLVLSKVTKDLQITTSVSFLGDFSLICLILQTTVSILKVCPALYPGITHPLVLTPSMPLHPSCLSASSSSSAPSGGCSPGICHWLLLFLIYICSLWNFILSIRSLVSRWMSPKLTPWVLPLSWTVGDFSIVTKSSLFPQVAHILKFIHCFKLSGFC